MKDQALSLPFFAYTLNVIFGKSGRFAHFATDPNVSARMLKLVKELNWFHAYLKVVAFGKSVN